MKTLLASVLMLSSLSVFACNPEAQFIGQVRNLTVTETGYTYQVSISGHYSANPFCPLYAYELTSAVLKGEGAPEFQNGDAISGVMVQDEATGEFHVE